MSWSDKAYLLFQGKRFDNLRVGEQMFRAVKRASEPRGVAQIVSNSYRDNNRSVWKFPNYAATKVNILAY